jgi:hypothetical protein
LRLVKLREAKKITWEEFCNQVSVLHELKVYLDATLAEEEF